MPSDKNHKSNIYGYFKVISWRLKQVGFIAYLYKHISHFETQT